MSFEAMAWATRQKPKTPTQRLIILHLASMANQDGICWPSYRHLADVTGLSRRTVMRNMNELCDHGFLIRKRRRDGNTNKSNVFTLALKGGGDTESPGVVTQSHQGGDTVTPGGSDTVSPRNSNSLETVIETRERADAPAAKKGRRTQLSEDQLPDDWRDYCVEKRPDLDPETVFENFADFYLGHGRVMKDWKRTWQRWVRNERGRPKGMKTRPAMTGPEPYQDDDGNWYVIDKATLMPKRIADPNAIDGEVIEGQVRRLS